MTERSKRILFLAMDAGDKELIRQMAGAGELPALRSLLDEGLVGETQSVAGLYEGATWPTFSTGVNPGRHGFHRTVQLLPGTYRFVPVRPGGPADPEPFWERLSRAGKRVAILDVPLAGPASGLNGIHMLEWGSHDAVYGFRTWPPGLRTDVARRFGRHPALAPCDAHGMSAVDYREFAARLLEGVELKRRLTLHYLNRERWDFFAQVFTEGHCAGHQCWHLHDPGHPDHDPAFALVTGDPLRQVYRAIDRAVGDIRVAAEGDTLVVFLASHRMAHNIGADFLLADILERLGVLKTLRAGGSRGLESRGAAEAALRAARRAWKAAPQPVRGALGPGARLAQQAVRRWREPAGRQPASWIDLGSSSCFPHQNGGLVSGIRVNLAGREPAGLVRPEETTDYCRRLTEDLLGIVDVATGLPALSRVIRTADLFGGDRLECLPDLLVEWSDALRVGSKAIHDGPSCQVRLSSPKIGLIEGEYRYCRTGDHRPEGLFAAAGPGIHRGALGATVSLMDLAPTFLCCFGAPFEDLDGRPIDEICASFAAPA